MRIRTIKPEFWSHPIMSRKGDDVRLCAIGLLNIADDEGYFLAEASLIRSSLWPFDEDSSKARRCLAQLSESLYIEVREHPSHGQIGFVLNFTKHQRVDRPRASTLKAYFLDDHSTNVRRSIADGMEGNGMEQGMEKECKGVRGGAGKKPWEPTPTQLRLGALFNRRHETRWSEKEIKALKAIGEIPEDELALVEKYHASKAEYRRRDIQTLLNNWNAEVDRARFHSGAQSGTSNKPTLTDAEILKNAIG